MDPGHMATCAPLPPHDPWPARPSPRPVKVQQHCLAMATPRTCFLCQGVRLSQQPRMGRRMELTLPCQPAFTGTWR